MCGPYDIKQGNRQEIAWLEKQFKRAQASQYTSEVPLSKVEIQVCCMNLLAFHALKLHDGRS